MDRDLGHHRHPVRGTGGAGPKGSQIAGRILSVAHLGFVVLGIFALNPQGIAGATLQMINHGLSTGALFLMVGMLYNQRHTRKLEDFGGLWKQTPAVRGPVYRRRSLSSAGLPGLNGFVGEFNILLGAFQANNLSRCSAPLASCWPPGTYWSLSAVCCKGHWTTPNENLKDLSRREIWLLVPLIILFFVIGLFPDLFLDKINPAVDVLIMV